MTSHHQQLCEAIRDISGLVEKKTYINTLETPGAARGMLRELVNLLEGNKVVGDKAHYVDMGTQRAEGMEAPA